MDKKEALLTTGLITSVLLVAGIVTNNTITYAQTSSCAYGQCRDTKIIC